VIVRLLSDSPLLGWAGSSDEAFSVTEELTGVHASAHP
jgi:hypothetical protein